MDSDEHGSDVVVGKHHGHALGPIAALPDTVASTIIKAVGIQHFRVSRKGHTSRRQGFLMDRRGDESRQITSACERDTFADRTEGRLPGLRVHTAQRR